MPPGGSRLASGRRRKADSLCRVGEYWALLVGGLFGLAAAWLPITLGNRADQRRRRAGVAATFLSECDRLLRATTERRSAVENGTFVHDGADAAFDAILGTLNAAGYELALLADADVQSIVFALLEDSRELVFSTLPALADELERRATMSRFTDHKVALIELLS